MKRDRRTVDVQTLPTVPESKGEQIMMHLIEYTADSFQENIDFNLSAFTGFNSTKCCWLNVMGLGDVNTITQLCNILKVHNIVIYDILDTDHPPKSQFLTDYSFFSVKRLKVDHNGLETRQISFIIHENYIVTFQDGTKNYFEHVSERLRKNVGLIREHSVDYLLYQFLETVLDDYQKATEYIEDQLERTTSFDVDMEPDPQMIQQIELFKRLVFSIDKLASPIRDFALRVNRITFPLVVDENQKFYNELRYLCKAIDDSCDKLSFRLDSASNFFFSLQGHRMNQIMKTLTIISVIFIPMTFVAGIYGMNFERIPGLHNPNAFSYFAIFMILLTILMLCYFKRRRWF